MPSSCSISRKINKHKRLHKDWINLYDPNSQDLTINGVLAKDQLWAEELLNAGKEETIMIYGVNSIKQIFELKIQTKPVIDEKSNEIICRKYNYQIFLDNSREDNKHFRCDESGIVYNIHNNRKDYCFPGLLVECLEPFQRWRIRFNGLLFDSNGNRVMVNMRWIWTSNSEVFDFRANCDTNYLSKQMSRFRVKIDDILEDRYVGCGQLKGVLNISGNAEEEIYLWGTRSKGFKILSTDERSEQNFNKSTLTAYSEKGIAFEIIKNISKDGNKSFYYGWALGSHGIVYPLKGIEFGKQSTDEEKQPILEIPNDFKININDKCVECKDLQFRSNGICFDLTINGHIASGILIDNTNSQSFFKQLEVNRDLCNLFEEQEITNDLVIMFDNKLGAKVNISGGKGSSLCLLKWLCRISSGFGSDFIVPNGFIVTTNAYKLLLKENPILNNTIETMQSIMWSKSGNSLKNECEYLMNVFTKVQIPNAVKSAIRIALTFVADINGNYDDSNDSSDDTLCAVRSSACGEDSDDISAAGQMTTYLGVRGLDDICKAVLNCWASQFSVNAVEYRRGYGQPINELMAVVVQQMIDCDVSGVMFTCDPVNGATDKIIINANYGIGESVVSAAVNPDNISLLINLESNSLDSKRSIKSIENIIIGAKELVIKISQTTGSGTEVKTDFSAEHQNMCCLSEEEIKILGEIGLKLHYYFGSARDIEWGIKDQTFYLFQSRPVTQLQYNEWELTHEFDSGQLDETEYSTKANVGEVFPGAMSPLNITSILRAMWFGISDVATNKFGIKSNPIRNHPGQGIAIHNYSIFFSLKDLGFFAFAPDKLEDMGHKSFVLAIFGHPVEDQQLRQDCFERNGIRTFGQKFVIQKAALNDFLFAKRQLKSTNKYNEGFDLFNDYTFSNSKDMVDILVKQLFRLSKCLIAHLHVTTKSSLLNLVLLSILSNGNIDVKTNPKLLIDFANVLSTTGNSIVSADLPRAINSLAKSIQIPEQFKQMTAEEALEWLESMTEDSETGKLYKKFMRNFGFRGRGEWDIMTTTWNDNKLQLVTTVQNMLPMDTTKCSTINTTTIDDLIRRIKTPMSRAQRCLLRRLLPACHRSVALREESKQYSVKTINKFRVFIREIANVMCYREGRIPEPDLIYFLTLHELKVLTEVREPMIVMKAKQRKRLHPKLDKYLYDECTIGPKIKPKNAIDQSAFIRHNYLNCGNSTVLMGTPVCTGSVTSRALVARCFDDAKHLKSGDILVTYSTDIGWSSCFAMVSGIITEIGGLVSHGAVIAREYGIPCLVGVENACDLLTTGDTILLDANNAQIMLLIAKE